MADERVVHIGENSPEQVAYRLMQDIARCEGTDLVGDGDRAATREWVLATFAQCLMTVRRPAAVSEHLKFDVPDRVEL